MHCTEFFLCLGSVDFAFILYYNFNALQLGLNAAKKALLFGTVFYIKSRFENLDSATYNNKYIRV